MKDCYPSPQLASRYVERSALLAQIVLLQKQILACDAKLVELVLSKQVDWKHESVRVLRDEIFGYRTEIQSLHVRANRLKAQTSIL